MWRRRCSRARPSARWVIVAVAAVQRSYVQSLTHLSFLFFVYVVFYPDGLRQRS